MVKIVKRGLEKEYHCEGCGKIFYNYGTTNNHEKWECSELGKTQNEREKTLQQAVKADPSAGSKTDEEGDSGQMSDDEAIIYSEKYDNAMLLSSPQIKTVDKWHGGDLTLTNSTLNFKIKDGGNFSLSIKNILRIYPKPVAEIVIVYVSDNGNVKKVTYFLNPEEKSEKLTKEIKRLDFQIFGASDSKELKKVRKIKEESSYFFNNEAGDYLAIFEDHLKMKVYDDNKEWHGWSTDYPHKYKSVSFEDRISYDGLMISFSEDGGNSGCPHIHFGQHGTWNKSEIIYFRNVKDWKNVKNLIEKTKAEYSEINISQKVVYGDEVTKTEIKDSVLNRSNVGESNSKMQELEKLTEMKEKGLIDDDEFKQMKKEILGK